MTPQSIGTLITGVIGTGGVLAHSKNAHGILSAALAGDDAPLALRPRSANFVLDRNYVLYACGLLSSITPGDALKLGLNMLRKEEVCHGVCSD